jgi:hypothetical protein
MPALRYWLIFLQYADDAHFHHAKPLRSFSQGLVPLDLTASSFPEAVADLDALSGKRELR